jgi:hypothetical protein
MTHAQDGDVITFSVATVTLQTPLPSITKSLTIEGNGVTLTRNTTSWPSDDWAQLLRIDDGKTVTIRRVHFKNGQTTEFGGAIYNFGRLTLESCIFSGNQTTASGPEAQGGGAVHSKNNLTLRGCTFYNNSAAKEGGAVFFYGWGTTLIMEGNLFYGNTGSCPIVRVYYGNVIASYNVVDRDYGADYTLQAGWEAGTGDTTFANLSISGVPFNTTTFVPLAGLRTVLPSSVSTDFPLVDFNGVNRTFPGAPGAVK